ncbi:HupE/UreJ family protein [soil metagenome]
MTRRPQVRGKGRRVGGLVTLLLVVAAPAVAHPGHETSGFVHPFTGIDHMLAMVGVGLWASLLAVRKPSMAWLVPAIFLVMMAIGAAAGFGGIKLPLVEAVILASVFLIGGLIIGAVRVPAVWAIGLAGLFAAFHGYAHALEAPASEAGGYILGFLLATALLQGLGVALGWVVRRLVGDIGVRALGGAIFAAGAVALITH